LARGRDRLSRSPLAIALATASRDRLSRWFNGAPLILSNGSAGLVDRLGMRGLEKLAAGRVTLRAVGALRPLLGGIRRRDRALSEQLVRAMTNVALCIARAEFPVAGTARGQLCLALASACEARAVLQIAIDSGYATERRAMRARGLLDQTRNLLLVWLREHSAARRASTVSVSSRLASARLSRRSARCG
jgi:hypothetical protein